MGRKRGVDQALILNTAAELVEEEGADHITLRRLAEKLGIRPSSLYNHVSGLDELSASLAVFSMRKLEGSLRNAAVGKARGDALLAMAGEYRRFARENPELYKAILKVAAPAGTDTREAHKAVVRIFHQVMESYGYNQEDKLHFIRGFRAALHGFVTLEEAGFFQARIDADTSFERLVSALICTLSPRDDANVNAGRKLTPVAPQ